MAWTDRKVTQGISVAERFTPLPMPSAARRSPARRDATPDSRAVPLESRSSQAGESGVELISKNRE